MYKPGDPVRIIRDLYDDGSCNFVGKVGRLTAVWENTVTVNGISDDQPAKSWGFDINEIEPA
jgi:hypothetical protein